MYCDNPRNIECCNCYPVGNYCGTAEYESIKAFGLVPRQCELDSDQMNLEEQNESPDVFEQCSQEQGNDSREVELIVVGDNTMP